jgi:hypothetical protein
MQNPDETEAFLASKGLNTIRFKAFAFESREEGSAYQECVARFELAINGSVADLAAILPDVEKAFGEWSSHD